MPNQPKTPVRTIRVDDELWDAVRREAEIEGETVSNVVRRALRKHLGLALVAALLLAGCSAASATPAAKPTTAAEWNGAHGLGSAAAYRAVAETAVSTTPEAKPYGSWGCATPMTFHPEVAPGVDVASVYRELEYPVAYLNALGYKASLGAQLPYEINAQAPTERGSITVVVAKNREDQADLAADHTMRAVALFAEKKGNESAALVIHQPRGLASDIILHEVGHVLGLDHKTGTVMNGVGAGSLVFDASETAAITCN